MVLHAIQTSQNLSISLPICVGENAGKQEISYVFFGAALALPASGHAYFSYYPPAPDY